MLRSNIVTTASCGWTTIATLQDGNIPGSACAQLAGPNLSFRVSWSTNHQKIQGS